MTNDPLLAGLPSTFRWVAAGPGAWTLRCDAGDPAATGCAGLHLPGLVRFCALHRSTIWWLKPVFGLAEAEIPGPTQCLVWERSDGRHVALMPLVSGNRQVLLAGGAEGLNVSVRGRPQPGDGELVALALAESDDPREAVRLAVEAGSAALGTATLRRDKREPAWVQWLGWCTWDAFYKDVDAQKVQDGLAAFQRDGLVPPLLIIDDGWQQYRDNQLMGMDADPAKFPGGLAPVVSAAKATYGVKMVGVWHALAGYWNGIHPESALSAAYRVVPSFQPAWNHPGGPLARAIVHPDDIHRFFDDWYCRLRAQGVDLVKVDNQASLDHACTNCLPEAATQGTYQRAVQGAAAAHFAGNLLHCMAMSADIAWRLGPAGTVWRSSDDYFPKRPETNATHLVNNAWNGLWAAHLALPDWDMFHSGHAAGAYHAAARAISGGPVYISDVPGKHDAALLRRLCAGDGRALRCAQPVRLVRELVYVDCQRERRLLRLVNRTAVGGLLGLFHVSNPDLGAEAPVIADAWSPDDAEIPGGRFAVWSPVRQSLSLHRRGERVAVSLGALGHDLLTVAPADRGCALLGRLDAFNGGAVVDDLRWIDQRTCWARLNDGGRIGLWAAGAVTVEVDGSPVGHTPGPDGLVAIDLVAGRHDLLIRC